MRVDDFDYELPSELIAHKPSDRRDSSRLMVLERHQDHTPQHRIFHELGEFLRAGDLLVMNDTKVFPARVKGKKETGGRVEVLFLRLEGSEERGEIWEIMARASRSLKVGMTLFLPEEREALVLDKKGDGIYSILFEKGGAIEFLQRHGEVPLPPYIQPEETTDHFRRYQTVYAKHFGAVAAPTAGLHFTEELLESLKERGIRIAWLTLHVGIGTFLPVRSDIVEEHQMHTEYYEIPQSTVDLCRETKQNGGKIIAVGTTSLRALEAATQHGQPLRAGSSKTDIFIYPGYQFQMVEGLLTNFHLPRSTLLMLVAAFHGRERILKAYAEAIERRYRFFSYGDAMLILPQR